ncbi:hypothetical protein ANANG_G00100660 [Anguilla anguilla]|uniref:Uncharacterized protein n=1 Tax=Anguilla anguilla TaxID=7936 RepID=A0A9D3MGS8_ANGAN|nr:hypothetical protein ANANG_G00100660 [Anguilla anguilla]
MTPVTSTTTASDEAWAQVSVGVLTVIREDVPISPNHLHRDPVSTAIIVEGGIVMDNLQNLPQALCLLFGLSYALHLDYPKAMKNTFSFIQRVKKRQSSRLRCSQYCYSTELAEQCNIGEHLVF